MKPLARRVPRLQKLRQCVAGASAMLRGDVEVFASSCAEFVENTSVRRSLDEGENVGLWNVSEWCEENGGEWLGEAAPFGDGLVRGRWRRVGTFVTTNIRAMWKGSRCSVSMRTKERDETDPWSLFVVDWVENWSSRGACELLVRTGISSTKVISNADPKSTTAPITDRYVTDLHCPGNDVTVSHSSSNLKHANSGHERQRTSMQKEALVDAVSLQQEFRRSFFLMLIIESRAGQDRLCDPKIYSATFKEQVHDAQSLRLVEKYSATFIQPASCAPGSATLFVSRPQLCSMSVFNGIITHRLEIDMDVWHYCVLQLICCSFSISVKEACSYYFMDLLRKLLLQVSHFW